MEKQCLVKCSIVLLIKFSALNRITLLAPEIIGLGFDCLFYFDFFKYTTQTSQTLFFRCVKLPDLQPELADFSI